MIANDLAHPGKLHTQMGAGVRQLHRQLEMARRVQEQLKPLKVKWEILWVVAELQ